MGYRCFASRRFSAPRRSRRITFHEGQQARFDTSDRELGEGRYARSRLRRGANQGDPGNGQSLAEGWAQGQVRPGSSEQPRLLAGARRVFAANKRASLCLPTPAAALEPWGARRSARGEERRWSSPRVRRPDCRLKPRAARGAPRGRASIGQYHGADAGVTGRADGRMARTGGLG